MQSAIIKNNEQNSVAKAAALLLLVFLPVGAYLLFCNGPAWKTMWAMTFAIYFSLKVWTFVTYSDRVRSSATRAGLYLLLWPGMAPQKFLIDKLSAVSPTWHEWLAACIKLISGCVLLCVVVSKLPHESTFAAGWLGMSGMILVAHFGLFHLLSLAFRQAGIVAEPIMNAPLRSSSLGDFWGRRWNSAFRDLAFVHVLRPLAAKFGVAWATLAVFLLSGLIHDLVISLPVQAGWGGPTLYFLIQAVGLLLERSSLGTNFGLARGWSGKIFSAVILVGPVGLLFHGPFVQGAVLPTLNALGFYR